MTGLGSKTTPEKLAEYLQNPATTDPAGRMPHMLLQQPEAMDLARFLCQTGNRAIKPGLPEAPTTEKMVAALKRLEVKAEDVAAFEKRPAAAQADDLGKRLVVAKGCVNCHTIAPGGKPLAPSTPFTDLEDLDKKPDAGCLADKPEQRGKAPAFAFTDADRDALRAFLAEGLKGAGTPAPAYAARETIKQMNCLACHSRDGEGGLSTDVVEQLRKFANAENAEAVAPPTLTGVGHKLRTAWMKQVLTGAARARPWMSLRMPQFGETNVGRLPEEVAALEGTNAGRRGPQDAVDGRQDRGRPHSHRQERLRLHLLPRPGRHRQHRHARPRPGRHRTSAFATNGISVGWNSRSGCSPARGCRRSSSTASRSCRRC